MKKKVAIIGTVGVPSRYGGFETLVHNLVERLHSKFNLTVYCSGVTYAKQERTSSWNGARLVYLPFKANGIQSIIYDIVSILHALLYADTLLIFGVSGGIVVPLVKLLTRKKVVVHIDGLEWRRNKWKGIPGKFLKFSEYLAVKFSDIDIADNAAIKKYTAINYKTLSFQIEYGADHTIKQQITPKAIEEFPFLSSPYAFSVCRIEPENNVHVILKAFSNLPNRTLVFIGNWENSEYGKKLKKQYSSFSNILLLDPIYDQMKLDIIRSNCYLYLHGHSAGGTNPSLVEAMYLELPVIAFDVSYNKATTQNEALYFKSSEQLQEVIVSSSQKQLETVKRKLKSIANKRYTWNTVCNQYANLIYAFDYDYSKAKVLSEFSNYDIRFLKAKGMAHLKQPKPFYES